MTREQLQKLGRDGLIKHAADEFGVGFHRFCGADKMVDELLHQYSTRENKNTKRKPGRPAK